MKQHITIEQLKELTDKQRLKLNKWYQPQDGDLVTYAFAITGEEWPVRVYPDAKLGDRTPVLSIGQMIEFLDDSEVGCAVLIQESGLEGSGWRAIANDHSYYATELCDALWEACKEVLENE